MTSPDAHDSNSPTRYYVTDFSKGHNKGSRGRATPQRFTGPGLHFFSPSRDLLRISGPDWYPGTEVYSPGEKSGLTWKEATPDPVDARQARRTRVGGTRSVDTWDLMDLVSQYGELEKFYDEPDRMDESIYSGAMVLRKAQEEGKLVPGLAPDKLPPVGTGPADVEAQRPAQQRVRAATEQDKFNYMTNLFVAQMQMLRLDLQRHKAMENPRLVRVFPTRPIPGGNDTNGRPQILQLLPKNPLRHKILLTNVGPQTIFWNTTREALQTYSGASIGAAGGTLPTSFGPIEMSDAIWVMVTNAAGSSIDIVETLYEDEFKFVGMPSDEAWDRSEGVDISKTEFLSGSKVPFTYAKPSGPMQGTDEPGADDLVDDDWPNVAIRKGTYVLTE